MTVRRLIEPQALPLVVLWATARDFAEMERCVAGGDQAASYEEFETWDLALHRCIIAAAHSPLLAALYGVVESARHGQVWGDLKRRSATRQRRELYQEDHRAIVAALRARDADAAVEAMRTHLARVAGAPARRDALTSVRARRPAGGIHRSMRRWQATASCCYPARMRAGLAASIRSMSDSGTPCSRRYGRTSWLTCR